MAANSEGAGGQLKKAKLKIKPETAGGVKKTELECLYNPKEYTITKGSSWKETKAAGAKQAPKKQFVGTNPKVMTMELVFDRSHEAMDVSLDVNTLMDWTNPTPDSLKKNKPSPPIVVFHWGEKFSFDAYVKQVEAKYIFFTPAGIPVRSLAKVTLEQNPPPEEQQNPTSGGIAGRRSHTVSAGESLHSIAHAEYGRAAYWRGLAAANKIDDPLRVGPGASLLIPPESEVARLS